MKTREDNPADWFFLAADRLRGADVLRQAEGVTFLGIEALHEAVERYLKGYLVFKGWELERIHDLSRLIECASNYDQVFQQYTLLADTLTQQFCAQHYPGGDLTEVGADYDKLRQQAGELIALILAAVPSASQPREIK
jgi:HEPN domain-containing protein